MTFEIWFSLLVLIGLLLGLYTNALKPIVVFFVAVIALLLGGVLSTEDVLLSFANEQLGIIVLLLIISDMLKKSPLINYVFEHLFSKSTTAKGIQIKMLAFLAPVSALLNNTPLVAMMIPFLYRWSNRFKVNPSSVFMSLSYIAILGGCITLIGTSTNLITNGLAVDAGYDSLHLLDFFPVGFTMLLIGGLYIVLFSAKLLPNKSSSLVEMQEKRNYFIEMRVVDNSPLNGKTIDEAGLRNLENLYLFEIYRKGKTISPVSPKEVLQSGDKLIFNGNIDSVDFFKQPVNGLSIPKKCELPDAQNLNFVEVVIAYNSPLINKKVKASNFRSKFDAAIMAIHRNGEQLSGKIGEITIEAGDVLLLLGGNDFKERTKNNPSFYVLSLEEEPKAPNVFKSFVLLAGLIGAVVGSQLMGFSLFTALLVVLGLGLLMQMVPPQEIRKGMDFNLVLMLALGLTIGKGITNSGLTNFLAVNTLNKLTDLPVFWLLLGCFLLSNVAAAYFTSKASVAIIFPLVASVANIMQIPIQAFVLIVAFGSAANFITPIGYQTNLMVYGPGGYSFKDFYRFGLPLTIIYSIVASLGIIWQFDL